MGKGLIWIRQRYTVIYTPKLFKNNNAQSKRPVKHSPIGFMHLEY